MTYGELRTQFLATLSRNDCTNAQADSFIEQGLARSQRLLKLPLQERFHVYTIAEPFTGLELPSDYLSVIALYTSGEQLVRKSLAEYLKYPTSTGAPRIWTRAQDDLLLKPTPTVDSEVTLLYYAEFQTFDTDASETPLSLISPDLIVYGGLCYASDHFLDERKGAFEDRYKTIAAELISYAHDDELSGGAQISTPYTFPHEDY